MNQEGIYVDVCEHWTDGTVNIQLNTKGVNCSRDLVSLSSVGESTPTEL